MWSMELTSLTLTLTLTNPIQIIKIYLINPLIATLIQIGKVIRVFHYFCVVKKLYLDISRDNCKIWLDINAFH